MKLKPLNLVKEITLEPEIDGFYRSKYWKDIRKMHLMVNPVCVVCGELANTVDHIKPKRMGGDERAENLQSLCTKCHTAKSSFEGNEILYAKNPKWNRGA